MTNILKYLLYAFFIIWPVLVLLCLPNLYVEQPTYICEGKKMFLYNCQRYLWEKVKTFYHLMYIFHFSLSPPFPSCLLLLHPPAFSPSAPPLSPLPSLFFCLCDVRYGIADFQTAPVDSSCNGEQSEHHQQRPCNVDPFGVPSWLPCAHLNTWINK